MVNPIAKLSFLIDLRGRLREIGPTQFEAQRPWPDPFSHGYNQFKNKQLLLRISHAFGPQGPGKLTDLLFCLFVYLLAYSFILLLVYGLTYLYIEFCVSVFCVFCVFVVICFRYVFGYLHVGLFAD